MNKQEILEELSHLLQRIPDQAEYGLIKGTLESLATVMLAEEMGDVTPSKILARRISWACLEIIKYNNGNLNSLREKEDRKEKEECLPY